ncbi:hypothetical protein [Moorena sp. SIO3I6]|uniref:hypothetical protein n=1 Tax=Moorena sp. SIO3I6 TaxID=2607831 RepID=UPI0025D66D2D|nr:hypothetical protein [Moorena sp. SIO3I6]
MRYTRFFPCSRLDAVAHGGFPQDRAASLLPAPEGCMSVLLIPDSDPPLSPLIRGTFQSNSPLF